MKGSPEAAPGGRRARDDPGAGAGVSGVGRSWTLLASLLLLGLVVLFCAQTRWGRMYPAMLRNSATVWTQGHVLNAAERRVRFYDETYPVLLYLRENTPPEAVVMLPPTRFIKEEVAKRRPPDEDLSPILSLASSAYSFLYPRVTVNYGDEAPLRNAVDYLLVWDHWGLDLIDPSAPRTEANRVKLFAAPPIDPAARAAAETAKRLPKWTGKSLLDEEGPDRWVTGGLLLGLLVLAGLGDGLYRLLRRAGLELGAVAAGRAGTAAFASGTGTPEDWRERIGWRLVLALGAIPFVTILCDLSRVPITRGAFVGVAALLALGGALVDRGRWTRLRPSWLSRDSSSVPAASSAAGSDSLPSRVRRRLLGWLRAPAAPVLALGAGSLVVLSLIQLMILPERNYDALVGWDLVGKVMAYEGKLRSSVFTRIVYNTQAIYAPFCASSNAFWYLFHPAINRLWVPIAVGGFLLLFHRRVHLWSGSATAASLAAFIVFLPQAFVTQLTMSMTDLPSMVYSALAIFAAVDLLRGGGNLGAPAVLFLAAATCRTENVLLAGGAAAVVMGAEFVRRRRGAIPAAPRAEAGRPDRPARLSWLRPLWIAAGAAAFFAFWNLFYVKGQFGYDPAAHFRPPGFDPARGVEVLRRAVQIIAMPRLFGEFWVLAALAPLAWLAGRGQAWAIRRRERSRPRVSADRTDAVIAAQRGGDVVGPLLVALLVTWLCYLVFFYLWDPVLNPLWSMEHTYKRGFFRFMPGITAAFFATPMVSRFLRRCDG